MALHENFFLMFSENFLSKAYMTKKKFLIGNHYKTFRIS